MVIDFDEFEHEVQITDQYAPFAVFSSVDGSFNETRQAGAPPLSKPNFICTSDDLCFDDTYVEFGFPVSDLTFVMIGASDPNAAAARVLSRGTELAFVELDDDPDEEYAVVDLSAYEGITRLELVDIEDDAGVGWDHFTFTAHVPR